MHKGNMVIPVRSQSAAHKTKRVYVFIDSGVLQIFLTELKQTKRTNRVKIRAMRIRFAETPNALMIELTKMYNVDTSMTIKEWFYFSK